MSNDLGKGTQQIYFGKMFATKVINKSTKKCLFRTSWLFAEKSVILQFSRKSQDTSRKKWNCNWLWSLRLDKLTVPNLKFEI